MTDKVVPFRKPETEEPEDRLVLVCSDCNCMTYYIHDDQTIECANCGNPIGSTSEWRLPMPDEPEAIQNTAGCVKITNMGSPEAACAAVLGDIRQWHNDGVLEVLVAYRKDGTGRSWLNLKNERDRKYYLTKLNELIHHVAKAEIDQCTCEPEVTPEGNKAGNIEEKP